MHIALDQGWMAWRWFVLRSAGFPARDVLALGAIATCRAIDRLFALEDEVARARDAAVAVLRAALDAVGDGDRKPLKQRLKQLNSDRVPEGDEPALHALRRARAAVDEQRAVIDRTLATDGRAVAAALRDRVTDPRFREALTWQNRTLLATLVEPLLAAPLEATDSRIRQKQGTVASYVQRYCVKNDTIGFFGPLTWGRLVDAPQAARLAPGPQLLADRRVHFEYWCIDALAAALAEEPALRAALAPRRMPTLRLDGTTLYYPFARSAQLEPAHAIVLAACDGQVPAAALAAALARDPAVALTAEEVLELIEELVAQKLVRWTFEIPTVGQHPERHLRAQLTALPAMAARDRALATLDALEAAREAVARAAGDPVALDAALRAIDALFSQLTGAAATRNAGQMYAARTLLYEDTRRAVELELGAPFVAQLGPPLTLLLASARWFTHASTRAYLPVFRAVYDELRARTGDATVDYLQYIQHIVGHFDCQENLTPMMRPIVEELHRRWTELLGVRDGGPAITWRSDELRAKVEAAFAAPGPGWPQARYHAPDVMISARDPEALRRGDFVSVLGELHTGVNTCMRPAFLNFHADPEALFELRRRDLGRPIVCTVEPRAHALRTDHYAPLPDDIDIETTDARSWRAASQVIPAAELVVEARDHHLVVRTRDGRHAFHIVEVLEPYLQLATEVHYSLLPAMQHLPRIRIDDLVIARETWAFEASSLTFATASGSERMIGVRRWARQHGVPRFVFVRVAQEPKPIYIDLESAVFVENFAKLVRGASVVKLSEMLPAIDHTWLPDADGATYTAEMRMAFVDPVAWQPSVVDD